MPRAPSYRRLGTFLVVRQVPNAVHRFAGLLCLRGVVLFEGHFAVDPDSEPPRGVLVELNFVASDQHRSVGFFRRFP